MRYIKAFEKERFDSFCFRVYGFISQKAINAILEANKTQIKRLNLFTLKGGQILLVPKLQSTQENESLAPWQK